MFARANIIQYNDQMKSERPDNLADNDCINLVLKGKKEYFRPLVERYYPRISSVVRRYLFETEAVRDVCQEAFLKAFAKINQFDQSRRFLPWITRIAINLALKVLEKNGRSIKTVSLDDCEKFIQAYDPDDKSQTINLFENCLEMLGDNLKILFALRHGLKLSYEEIAFVLDESDSAVKSALFRVRKTLKQRFLAPYRENEAENELEN